MLRIFAPDAQRMAISLGGFEKIVKSGVGNAWNAYALSPATPVTSDEIISSFISWLGDYEVVL